MSFSSILSFISQAWSPFSTSPKPASRRRSDNKTLALPPLHPNSPPIIAIIGSAAITAAIFLTDPERRRQQQALEICGSDKEVVSEYFNSTGFDRWKKIYGDATNGVSMVQLDIRLGHAKTVENAIRMLKEDGPISGLTICDAGCGTGCLAIPLAREGAIVSASDISAAMVEEARRQAGETTMPEFEVRDLEELEGKYHTVVCIDVLIHYPREKAEDMIAHLASLAEKRLVFSFAPKTLYYRLLKRMGELFPGPSKATRAYLHAESDVELALANVGWRVKKREFARTRFYFAYLLEAVPIA